MVLLSMMIRSKLKSVQMSKGFIFNMNKCAGCRSCIAACILENGWSIQTRNIIVSNEELSDDRPVLNISIACNHCEKPVCLDGCPAGSYSRDVSTGAIIINEERCLGCRYCEWNCPYDAPKFSYEKRVIGKCNLCYKGLYEGRFPACVNACPTGALSFGEIERSSDSLVHIPGKELNPALKFSGVPSGEPLRIIPENNSQSTTSKADEGKNPEWSLVFFSFMATLSAAGTFISLLDGSLPGINSLILLIATGFVSFLHLGKKTRAWRALTNLKTSPLSREIAAFLLFGMTLIAAFLTRSSIILLFSAVSGAVLLITIDAVYWYSDNRRSTILHSGQTFVSSLIIVSFFAGNIISFIFIGFLKVLSTAFMINKRGNTDRNITIRFLRIFILIAVSLNLIISGKPDVFITAIFLLGELSDRVLYYIDFEPSSIKKLIHNLILQK